MLNFKFSTNTKQVDTVTVSDIKEASDACLSFHKELTSILLGCNVNKNLNSFIAQKKYPMSKLEKILSNYSKQGRSYVRGLDETLFAEQVERLFDKL